MRSGHRGCFFVGALLVGSVIASSCASSVSGSVSKSIVVARRGPATTTPLTEEVLVDPSTSQSEPDDQAGSVQVLVHAKSAFDPWTRPLDDSNWVTMRDSFDSMIVYSPYFDARLPMFEDAYVYIDLYGLHVTGANRQIARTNPDFLLRTSTGDPVYIPWGCEGVAGCPQYAADVGSAEYQDHFVGRVRSLVDVGYENVLIDDVNLVWRLSDSTGERIEPVNPRTGKALTIAEWRSDVVVLLERLHDEFPDTRFMHNSIWFADSPDFDDEVIDRQIAAADVIMLERGANDRGLGGGDGQFGFASFIAFIDRVHDLGASVLLLDQSATTDREQTFNLATVLLVNQGADLVSTQDYELMQPGAVWPGFEVDLGQALGDVVEVDGVWRRDFERGIVVLNEPEATPRSVWLEGEFVTEQGEKVTRLQLDEREAVILYRSARHSLRRS